MIILLLPFILVSWVVVITSPNETTTKRPYLGEKRESIQRKISRNVQKRINHNK